MTIHIRRLTFTVDWIVGSTRLNTERSYSDFHLFLFWSRNKCCLLVTTYGEMLRFLCPYFLFRSPMQSLVEAKKGDKKYQQRRLSPWVKNHKVPLMMMTAASAPMAWTVVLRKWLHNLDLQLTVLVASRLGCRNHTVQSSACHWSWFSEQTEDSWWKCRP